MSMHQDNLPPLQDPAFQDLMELFNEKSYWQRLKHMYYGLRQPRESGDYKLARTELQRQWAPLTAVVVPSLCVLLLALFANKQLGSERAFETEIVNPEEIKELEQIEEPEPPPEEIQPRDVQFEPDISMQTQVQDAPMSPQPQTFDAVLQVKSPVILRNIYGSTRNAGMRGELLGKGGGNAATEAAVMRALRWLKKYQESDGSWRLTSAGGPRLVKNTAVRDGAPVGITGLGVLTFLAHGETPASPEFGATVQSAIEYLIGSLRGGGTFATKDGRKDYSHLIATYALCEATAMTQNPNVKDAAERAMYELLRRQKPEGGWDYIGEQAPGRIDVSMTSWAAQAMKAGTIAGLSCEGLEAALPRTIAGLKLFHRKQGDGGHFTYRNTENRWPGLTGAATLCLQLLGDARSIEARHGVAWLRNNVTFNWDNPGPNLNENPIYNWYYITQVMFYEGASVWSEWNKQFSMPLVDKQKIIPKAIEDLEGRLVDIGYWEPATEKEWSQSPAYNTTFCALQLMVYYRYLPTFKALVVEDEVVATATDRGDIKVNVDL
jgi:hypothetical protein